MITEGRLPSEPESEYEEKKYAAINLVLETLFKAQEAGKLSDNDRSSLRDKISTIDEELWGIESLGGEWIYSENITKEKSIKSKFIHWLVKNIPALASTILQDKFLTVNNMVDYHYSHHHKFSPSHIYSLSKEGLIIRNDNNLISRDYSEPWVGIKDDRNNLG